MNKKQWIALVVGALVYASICIMWWPTVRQRATSHVRLPGDTVTFEERSPIPLRMLIGSLAMGLVSGTFVYLLRTRSKKE